MTRNKTRPEKGNLADDVWLARVELWEDRQERVVAAITHRLSFNARHQFKNEKVAHTLMEKLRKNFRPKGVGIFQELCTRFENLKLADYEDVNEYQEKFRKIRTDFSTLSAKITFPECYIVQKFLLGLGPTYSSFQTSFNQNHKVLPTDEEEGQAGAEGITFDEVVAKVLDEEKRMALSGSTIAFIANTNERAITIRHCTHCNKDYHDSATCWKLHPELRRDNDKKRRKGQTAGS